jgi:hypothetical protein
MSDCRKCRDLFVEALYDELDADQKQTFSEHLKSCRQCAESYEEMTSTAQSMRRRIQPEPESVFWSGYWDRLAERLDQTEKSKASANPIWTRLREILRFEPKWIVRVATATALVIVGVFIGRIAFGPDRVNQQMAGQIGETRENIHLASLEQRTDQYLERSKILILGLINFDEKTEDPFTLDLPYQAQISQNLVDEAAVLKKELKDPAQKKLHDLVADLEVILLQIANLESGHDLSAIEMVKSGVDRRGILLKINLNEMQDSAKSAPESDTQKKESKTSI